MRFFDFFSGIGGFRLGMEMAGHECVGHCEIDKYANMSYAAMHKPKESEVFFDDIRTINPSDMPECECYCGGFPCQSFSIAGKRGGFKDTRGTLFFEIMRLAKARKPEYIFLENVRGLLNHDGGVTFETIIRTMVQLGYGVEWQVLDSKHFCVPQHRERVFIVGHLGGICGRAIFPIVADGETACVAQRHENNRNYGGIIQIAKLNVKNRDNPQSYRVYDAKGVCPTLNCMEGGGLEPHIIIKPKNKTNSSCIDDYRIRKLTPKECFRCQGFPDEYFERAAEVCSNRQLYKQAGNSVTVNVIYEIAKKL